MIMIALLIYVRSCLRTISGSSLQQDPYESNSASATLPITITILIEFVLLRVPTAVKITDNVEGNGEGCNFHVGRCYVPLVLCCICVY